MALKIEDVFPNANTGLSSIGFFFGAGTSKEAGYPLTEDLTKEVLEGLASSNELIDSMTQKRLALFIEARNKFIHAVGKYDLDEDQIRNILILASHILKDLRVKQDE